MDFDYKKIISAIAPSLGAALGGPAGAVAVSAVIAALGLSPKASAEDVAEAVQSLSSADILALKKADQEFALRMKELDTSAEKDRLSDLDSARKREVAVQDKAVPRLAALVVAGFIGMSVVVLTGSVKVDSVLAGTVIGYVSGACTQVLSYYFGTSKSSSDKNALIAQAQKK